MKICLLLQRRFAYLGHQIACDLQERYQIKDFCAYVYLRSSYRYLQEQKDVQYSAMLLEEDIHKSCLKEKIDFDFLKKLESEYGLPNLWPYIEVDRIIRFNQLVREYPYDTCQYTHEELMLLLQGRAKAIIEMLDREKPDYLICSVASGLGSFLLYHLAKKKGVKPIFINFSRLDETKHILASHYAIFPEVEEAFGELVNLKQRSLAYNQAREMIMAFRQKPQSSVGDLTGYLKRSNRLALMNFLLPKNLKRYFSWLVGELKRYFSLPDRLDYSYIKPWHKIIDQLKRKIRNLRGVADLYDPVDLEEEFVFFPLHYEPEIATSLYAPFYTDQLHLIKQVAKSLPLTCKLYVKEHPGMVEFRKRSYYRELKKIPNVKLIHPRLSSFTLLPKMKLLVTITGTAGWEALLLGKPVITFGEIFYNKISAVKRCRDIEQLSYLIKEQLENFKVDEEELINFFACILDQSFDLDLEHLWHKEGDEGKIKEGVKSLTDALAKKMEII